jgi:hypothetical protein
MQLIKEKGELGFFLHWIIISTNTAKTKLQLISKIIPEEV